MRILLASPFFSQHLDAGWFWLKALSDLGHHVVIWDYRLQSQRPEADFDVALVMKGGAHVAEQLWQRHSYGAEVACYWPDAFDRDPENERALFLYDKVFTPVRPTPESMVWLPTGWDPDIHRPLIPRPMRYGRIFIGTCTERKERFLNAMRPEVLFGNGWDAWTGGIAAQGRAIYLHEYVEALCASLISINLHRDEIGVNRRFFESMACTFTITDIVPGVEEILGKELTEKVGFRTPEEGREKVEYFHVHHEEREELWTAEREAIKPFTYLEAARRVLEAIGYGTGESQ